MSSLTLEVNGTQYAGFTGASVEIRLDALSNTFSFEALSDQAQQLPFKGGESCRVFVDEEQVLAGFIELVNVQGDGSSHSIQVQGRDRTADLLDSSIGPPLGALRAPITLKALCQRVIKNLKTDIEVVDLVNPAPFSPTEDIADPEPGDNAFEFLERYARKRQVLLSSNADGDMLITASSGEETTGSLVNRIGDPEGLNNVLTYSVSYDSTGRYNLYRAISQLNPDALSLAGDTDALTIASQGDLQQAIDEEIREGRQRILISEAMTSSANSTDRATWEANIRKARGRVYSCTVSGYQDQAGDLWRVNTLPTVLDDDAAIEARMLVNSVSFQLSAGRGSATTLTFVERNAYTLQLEEPVTVKETVGDAFFA